jgi:epoxyqueuosine reductase
MGNALAADDVSESDKDLLRQALQDALPLADALVAEHIDWALSS